MLIFGTDVPAIFANSGFAQISTVAAGIGTIAGLALWGFGLWWLLLAILITIRYFRQGNPFKLGWWGYTFPLGVFAIATLKLGTVLQLSFFAFVGAGLVATLIIMWCVVALKTLHGGWKGQLFVSPCIASIGFSLAELLPDGKTENSTQSLATPPDDLTAIISPTPHYRHLFGL